MKVSVKRVLKGKRNGEVYIMKSLQDWRGGHFNFRDTRTGEIHVIPADNLDAYFALLGNDNYQIVVPK